MIFFLNFLFISICAANISYSPDEKCYAEISDDGKIKVCELKIEREGVSKKNVESVSKTFFLLKGADDNFYSCVSWSPDGRFIAAGSVGGFVEIWSADDLENMKNLKTLKASQNLESISTLSWSLDSNFLAVILKDKIIKIWESGSFHSDRDDCILTIELNNLLQKDVWQIESLDWSPCGNFIAVNVNIISKSGHYKIDAIVLDVSEIHEKM